MLFGSQTRPVNGDEAGSEAGDQQNGVVRVASGDRPRRRNVGGAILAPQRWALFLDVDGTIVDIAGHPDQVIVDPDLSRSLLSLRELLGGALALISGRSIAVLDDLLAPAKLDASGLHGLEWRHDSMYCGPPQGTINRIHDAARSLRAAVASMQGVHVEDKGATVAVHYRLASHFQGEVRAIVADALRDLGSEFRMQSGKAVLEIVHADAGKERAIARFLTLPAYRGRYPVFAGDDETDENALSLVNEAGGLSVHVGLARPTIAHLRVTSPHVMRSWLGRLASEIAETSKG